VFEKLHVSKPEHLNAFASKVRLVSLADGVILPTLKKGMFIVLEG